LQVPIVPVAIEGFYETWPRGKRFQRFAPLQVAFGDRIDPPPETESSEGAYQELIAGVKRRVVGMRDELRKERCKRAPS